MNLDRHFRFERFLVRHERTLLLLKKKILQQPFISRGAVLRGWFGLSLPCQQCIRFRNLIGRERHGVPHNRASLLSEQFHCVHGFKERRRQSVGD